VFLETERFIINKLNLDDLQFLAKLDSDPLVRKYLDGKVKTIDETREYLSENIESYWRFGFGRYAVRTKENLKPIGICGFLMEDYGVDFGYRLSRAVWGHGIATEVANSVIKYGIDQLKLRQITGIVLPDNIASERVLVSTGFIFVGMEKLWEKKVKRYEIIH
jgi:ribosomal-protein-alanine N-acetyltransferase